MHVWFLVFLNIHHFDTSFLLPRRSQLYHWQRSHDMCNRTMPEDEEFWRRRNCWRTPRNYKSVDLNMGYIPPQNSDFYMENDDYPLVFTNSVLWTSPFLLLVNNIQKWVIVHICWIISEYSIYIHHIVHSSNGYCPYIVIFIGYPILRQVCTTRWWVSFASTRTIGTCRHEMWFLMGKDRCLP